MSDEEIWESDIELESDIESVRVSNDDFQLVFRNLKNIGALSLDDYLELPVQYSIGTSNTIETVELPSPPSPPQIASQLPSNTPFSKATEPPLNIHAVTQLHHACQRAFGRADGLTFDFVEESGPQSKQCILTIRRPDGSQRSYTTKPSFSRKHDAKSKAATIAVAMGAIEFIATGDPDTPNIKRGLVLAPLGQPEHRAPTSGAPRQPEDDAPVKEIESCCLEWRAGRVKPHWVTLCESKLGHKQGCALRIELSPHLHRVYASDTVYTTFKEAQVTCAKTAIEEGVLDFIRYGNGQTRPASPRPLARTSMRDIVEIPPSQRPPLTLQNFYDTLPRPFPEPLHDKNAADANALSWLSRMVQVARGSRLTTSFVFTSGGTIGLHGCLLRLDRPGESKLYLVDPRFPKRADAKAAVCLQAMSQGVGDYIRSVAAAADNKITPAMKTWVNDHVVPVLASEYSKIKPGSHPQYEFTKDKDAFGCTMIVELSHVPTPEEVKIYTVQPEYRTKADAKIGATCLATEQGVIEFLRFRGQPPPRGYESPFSLRKYEENQAQRTSEKRKEPGELDDMEDQRRPKKSQKLMANEKKPKKGSNKSQRKNPSIPGPSGAASAWDFARSGSPAGHHNHGFGNASDSPSARSGFHHEAFGGTIGVNPPFADAVGSSAPVGFAPPIFYAVAGPPPQFLQHPLYATQQAPGYYAGQPYYSNTAPSRSYVPAPYSNYVQPPVAGTFHNPQMQLASSAPQQNISPDDDTNETLLVLKRQEKIRVFLHDV